jgi:hypothetical protein
MRKRLLMSLLRDTFPDEFPKPELSPYDYDRLQLRARELAKLEPWKMGRIGAVETQVCRELTYANMKGIDPSTGDLVRAIYCNPLRHLGKPPPKIQHYMYFRVRTACEVFATRVGRSKTCGRSILWRIRPNLFFCDVRQQKTAKYAARRQAKSDRNAR